MKPRRLVEEFEWRLARERRARPGSGTSCWPGLAITNGANRKELELIRPKVGVLQHFTACDLFDTG